MRKVIASAAVAAAALLAGCSGSGDDEKPSATSPSPTETSPAPAADEMLITPGAVGDAEVGMTVDEALDTGLFEAEVKSSCDGVEPLGWKPPLDDAFDVYVADDEISSLGVVAEGPKTAEGLGVGDTLGDFRGVYETAELREAGYGQSGLFVTDGSAWLGLLFDAPMDSLDPDAPVTFIEVTDGARPGLMRDGC